MLAIDGGCKELAPYVRGLNIDRLLHRRNGYGNGQRRAYLHMRPLRLRGKAASKQPNWASRCGQKLQRHLRRYRHCWCHAFLITFIV